MSTDDKTAYPLFWPMARPRCRDRKTNNFFMTKFADARDGCLLEIKRLGGSDPVISTNIPLRRDGLPSSVDFGKTVHDPGVAVYFKRNAKELCFACDQWVHVQDNMHAIRLTIEALRGIKRWGSGDMMEAAFRGFMALPAPGQSSALKWWEVLGVPINSPAERVRDAYRQLAIKHHPDRGGDQELFLRLREAWDQFNQTQRAA